MQAHSNTAIFSKKLSDIDSELEKAVFLTNYNSQKQIWRRRKAAILLSIKHAARGLLFSWPLYLLPFSVFALPEEYRYLFFVFLLPGVYVSFIILRKGIYEDYMNFVSGRLLQDGYLLGLIRAKPFF